MAPSKKIVAIGPESTGKSFLCEVLAKRFQTLWVPEFARQYLMNHGKEYQYDDLLTIAKGQLALEEGTRPPAGYPLFIDTDMYVMKVWCEYVFGKCHSWILQQIVARKYDLYLLCNTDLPWSKDELREYPDIQTRERLFHMYKDCMVNQRINWIEISGDHDERLQTALAAVNSVVSIS
jgi:NadR type nicotinamide-nucleotide adenylyltransferase